jgi:putative ABC transport system permease protein
LRTADLLSFGLAALWRQKLRTILTLLGVVIGTATLVISVSVGLGVRAAIDEQFQKEDSLRQISVFPNNDSVDENYEGVPPSILNIPGEMSEEKRERIRKLEVERWKRRQPRPPKPMTREKVEELRLLPHVVDVIPQLEETGRAFLGDVSLQASLYGVPYDYRRFKHRLVMGDSFSAAGARECIVHEILLYRLGIRDDADVAAAIGSTIRIEITNASRAPLRLLSLFDADLSKVSPRELEVLEKAWKLLPNSLESLPLSAEERKILIAALRRKKPGDKKQEEKIVSEVFTIVGVVRAPVKSDPPGQGFLDGPIGAAEVILPTQVADAFLMKLPRWQEGGYNRVRVIVDHEDNLESVVDDVKRLGLQEFSMGVYAQQIRKNVLLIGLTMDFIALVAIIVSAIGITNTMFTTVLEKTREIGIMKAIGAKDRQILTIFLIEGTLIGLVGGIGGVIVGWLASFPGNNYALHLMEKQGAKSVDTVFLYPLWLLIVVPVFAMAMTTFAALLPARRAARIEPVEALRHE